MMEWKQQESALVGLVPYGGTGARVVLVGARNNPKGAVLIVPTAVANQAEKVALSAGLLRLSVRAVIDILCAQERQFGKSALPPVIAT